MKQEEKRLEEQCRAYARRKGWLAWKNEKNGCNGIPDDTFLSPDGAKVYLIEFKKPSIRCDGRTQSQLNWARKFPKIVKRIDNFEEFCHLIDGENYPNPIQN